MKHSKSTRVRFATALSALATVCSAAPAIAQQSLSDVLQKTYVTNPTLQAQRASQRAVSEQKAQAWAQALPQITAGGAYQKTDGSQSINAAVFGGVGVVDNEFNITTLSGQVNGELVLFNGLRNVNTIKQAAARIRAGGAELAAVEQDILAQTASAYFDVVRDAEVYAANLNNVKVLARQKEQADLRFEVGEVTRTDVAQADARLAGARAQLTSAQAQLAISRARFAQLTGEAPGTLDKSPAMPETPASILDAQALARQYAPTVIAAKAQEVASRKNIAIAKSAFAPQISLSSTYRYADEPSVSVLDSEEFVYGLTASVPIFQGGLNLSRVKEARALNDADRRRVEESERRAETAVASAWEQLFAANSNIRSAEAQREANTLALEGVRREAEFGTRTTLDVLNAEQELLNSAVAVANAQRDARVATFTLLANIGLLTPAALGFDDAHSPQE